MFDSESKNYVAKPLVVCSMLVSCKKGSGVITEDGECMQTSVHIFRVIAVHSQNTVGMQSMLTISQYRYVTLKHLYTVASQALLSRVVIQEDKDLRTAVSTTCLEPCMQQHGNKQTHP